jgi:hypothetical protein
MLNAVEMDPAEFIDENKSQMEKFLGDANSMRYEK